MAHKTEQENTKNAPEKRIIECRGEYLKTPPRSKLNSSLVVDLE